MYKIYHYPEGFDIRDAKAIAEVSSSELAEKEATRLNGVAVVQPENDVHEAYLEKAGWTGIFESEGWEPGETRMIYRP